MSHGDPGAASDAPPPQVADLLKQIDEWLAVRPKTPTSALVEASRVLLAQQQDEIATLKAEIESETAEADRWNRDYVALKTESEALARQLAQVQQVLADASTALDELVAPDSTKPLAQRIRDEFHDFKMVLDHVTTVYDHFSRGRISKPNTLPSEVITLADDFATEDINEAIAEAKAEWDRLAQGRGHQEEQELATQNQIDDERRAGPGGGGIAPPQHEET